jgi:hypothetical protein
VHIELAIAAGYLFNAPRRREALANGTRRAHGLRAFTARLAPYFNVMARIEMRQPVRARDAVLADQARGADVLPLVDRQPGIAAGRLELGDIGPLELHELPLSD